MVMVMGMDRQNNFCVYCKFESGHGENCFLANMSDHSPAAVMARSWSNNPNESVWHNYSRDDLGNPVLVWRVPPRENAVELNGSAFANFPR
jgi:hypothetical protein